MAHPTLVAPPDRPLSALNWRAPPCNPHRVQTESRAAAMGSRIITDRTRPKPHRRLPRTRTMVVTASPRCEAAHAPAPRRAGERNSGPPGYPLRHRPHPRNGLHEAAPGGECGSLAFARARISRQVIQQVSHITRARVPVRGSQGRPASLCVAAAESRLPRPGGPVRANSHRPSDLPLPRAVHHRSPASVGARRDVRYRRCPAPD